MTLKGPKLAIRASLRLEMTLRLGQSMKIITDMAKQDQKPTGDNRKFKVRSQLLERLDALAERKATDVTELVNQAVRELLEREGLWPPKPEDKRAT